MVSSQRHVGAGLLLIDPSTTLVSTAVVASATSREMRCSQLGAVVVSAVTRSTTEARHAGLQYTPWLARSRRRLPVSAEHLSDTQREG